MAFLDSLLAVLGGGARGYAGRRASQEASAAKQDELNREYGYKAQQLGLQGRELDEATKYHLAQLGMDQKQLDELAKYHEGSLAAEKYRTDAERQRAMEELWFKVHHPELITGSKGPTPDEMKLRLITDVYGTPQFGVTQDVMDEAYNRAFSRAQQVLPNIFGAPAPTPPSDVDLFLKDYTTQDEVSNALKQLRQVNPLKWTQIGPAVAEATRGWPKHKRSTTMGPPMPTIPAPSIPGNYRPR